MSPSDEPLRVLVHGTGYAGQGHAKAFRYNSVEVAGIVGRTDSVVTRLASEMEIPFAGTDWESALDECQPSIVAIGTPGGAHVEPIRMAIDRGCHVFCDKPLTVSGDSAVALHRLAIDRGVKTAYAASYRYMPAVFHAKQLVADGTIGEPLEVECISHFDLERGIPFGWSHRMQDGGGRLNNNFTHKLSIVTSVLGDDIFDIRADLRDDLGRAPIVDGVHHFLTRRDHIPEDLKDPSLQWGKSDVEWSYTVLARLRCELAAKPVSVLFRHAGLQPRFREDHIVFYGSAGAIYIEGHYGGGPLHYRGANEAWRVLELPTGIATDMPDEDDDTQRNWNYLAREFVKDIRGEPFAPYQTFADGARYQQWIDEIRRAYNWST